jgi:DNA-binding beta-propeller fold protein YncE
MFTPASRWLLLSTLTLLTNVAHAREWQDTTGNFKLEADLIGVVGDKVKLKKLDGGIIEVPLAKLSARDQAFVKEWQTADPKAALIAMLSDMNNNNRRKVLYDLMQMNPPVAEVLPHLIKAAESSDIDLADSAIHCLAEMGAAARAALPTLERVAKQPNRNTGGTPLDFAILSIRYCERRFGVAGADDIEGLALTPDDKAAIISAADGLKPVIKFWDLATGKETRNFTPKAESLGGIALSSDGKQLAVAADETLQIIDPATGNLLRTLTDHRSPVGHVAWSPTKKLFASTNDNKQTLIHDASGKLVTTIAGHRDYIGSLIFMPGGTRVITSGADEIVISSDTTTGEQSKEFNGHIGTVTSLAVTTDSKRLAGGCSDGSVVIWETKSAKVLKKWQAAHEDLVSEVIFSPDNQILVTSGHQSAAKAWDAATGKLITDLPCGHTRFWQFTKSGEQLVCADAVGRMDIINWKEVQALGAKK